MRQDSPNIKLEMLLPLAGTYHQSSASKVWNLCTDPPCSITGQRLQMERPFSRCDHVDPHVVLRLAYGQMAVPVGQAV